ncbi:hypothetical protein C9374_008009 [Naegleria lovaniensis]|uniref:Tubulin alpha chain n=1 Tax=Naegleria lovaniensis TaxID=51637 RepID=A0AA88GLW7_NAELO|nr:uncharacterized protein C9374_008009 [Naegleria lovaniensis]KAG2378861.1 hypothetical protein C9374_008009 [Naegleria lovaniensis]
MVGEIASLHVGSAGCAIGEQLWTQYAIQHGIATTDSDPIIRNEEGFKSSIFEMVDGKDIDYNHFARAVFVDTDSEAITKIKSRSNISKLVHPDNLISGKEGSSDNFVRGYYTVGRDSCRNAVESVRKIVEKCDRLEGFNWFQAFGGGTGSGVAMKLLDELATEYPKLENFFHSVFPSSKYSTSVVETYNFVFGLESLLEKSSVTFVTTNEAMYNYCQNHQVVSNPDLTDINKVLAQFVCTTNACLRFPSQFAGDMKTQTIHLAPSPGCSLVLPAMVEKKHMNIQYMVTKTILSPSHCLAGENLNNGKALSACLHYTGPKIKTSELSRSSKSLREDLNFADECGGGVKVNYTYENVVNGTLSFCCNHSSVVSLLKNQAKKFDLMYGKCNLNIGQ